jgi:UDPglucose--hexose-1-phosphate uridylyltransferase
MHRLEIVRPDGRALTLYGRAPIVDVRGTDGPASNREPASPHFRWHPLRGEWVAYAAHRQTRTFLPAGDANPLRPSADPAHPTELPVGTYDIAVFDNLFPALSPTANEAPQLDVPTMPATGHCEVVVFTQDPYTHLGALDLDRLCLLFEVWAARTETHRVSGAIRYVLPFENRGVEMGVTLHHPHGQIYGYPFVPPIPQRMNDEELRYHRTAGGVLLADLIAKELDAGERMLYAGEHAVAFVPAWARYTYEVWIAPRRSMGWFSDLREEERVDLARALKTVLLKYDGLWQRPFPYLMAWFQAPLDGEPHLESHLHAEFYPPYRTRDRLKYLAGTELAAGMFASDALPEASARELRAVEVRFDAAT